MSPPWTERHQRGALTMLAILEARLDPTAADSDARVAALSHDPEVDSWAVAAAAIEALAGTLRVRLDELGQCRQIELWRASVLRRPVKEEQ